MQGGRGHRQGGEGMTKTCKTCKHKKQSVLYPPCSVCSEKDKWEVIETIIVGASKLIGELEGRVEVGE